VRGRPEGAAIVKHAYERLPDPGDGLRLHLNENTAGCSPRVLEAMRALTRTDASLYPDYTAAHEACAAWLGLAPRRVALVNGLDEGIHAVSFSHLQRAQDGSQREALIVLPAFDMYAACAEIASARIVHVLPGPEFAFPIDEVLGAVSEATRVVFLTSPNNPTGLPVTREHVVAIARALPPGAVILLDEAYVDFARESLLALVEEQPNVVIGRTFAKAHGLAAVRAGCIAAHPSVMDRVRPFLPPYSINVFARAAIVAALADREYLDWYVAQVRESRRLTYEACGRLGLTYWSSEANFVLIRVGERARDLVAAMAARGVFIRDRTSQPGCAGCVRLTTGVVEHTVRALALMEEILCAAG
jgi:histidinol-phosphate aminotransferase